MKIAVLALQGAFIEHEQRLHALGVDSFQVRQLSDWKKEKDALIIPGGESTTQIKLLSDLHLMDPIRRAIQEGLPVFGTCAGLILLASHVLGETRRGLATMDMIVCRNAYGRQLGSFHTIAPVVGVGHDVPMTFIRAPYIEKVEQGVDILSIVDQHIVAARQGAQLVTAFHPELDPDTRLHEYFLNMVKETKK